MKRAKMSLNQKKNMQQTQEEADITENVSQQELQKQTTIVTQDKKVENPKQAETT